MSRSWTLSFTARGLRIYVSPGAAWLFVGVPLLQCALSGWQWRSLLLASLYVVLTYLSGLVHELAHILVARRFGLSTSYVRLSAAGLFVGMREVEGKLPCQRFLIALSGLSASAGLGLLLAGIVAWAVSSGHRLDMANALIQGSVFDMLGLVALTNLAAATVNLAPILPLDGGKMLYATLVHFMPAVQAQRAMSQVGQLLAIALVVGCVWPVPAPLVLGAVAAATWIFGATRRAVPGRVS